MSDQRLEGLQKLGKTDLKGAMERVLGDPDFYWELLGDLLWDEDLITLGKELEAGNAAKAFEAAHSLKGVISNLGLLQLFDSACGMVEPLRHGMIEGMQERYDLFMKQIEQYRKYYNSVN